MKFKVVLLGEANVGKTAIVNRFVKNSFDQAAAEPTIGAAYINKKITIENEIQLELDIWDTAGNDRFKDLAPMYYRGSHGALVVYDITDASSLEKAKFWIRELNEKLNDKCIVALVGNKCDLGERRQVRQADSSEYAKEKGFSFRETSARTSENVQSLFEDLATQMYHQFGNRIERKTIRLGQTSPIAHKKSCCNI